MTTTAAQTIPAWARSMSEQAINADDVSDVMVSLLTHLPDHKQTLRLASGLLDEIKERLRAMYSYVIRSFNPGPDQEPTSSSTLNLLNFPHLNVDACIVLRSLSLTLDTVRTMLGQTKSRWFRRPFEMMLARMRGEGLSFGDRLTMYRTFVKYLGDIIIYRRTIDPADMDEVRQGIIQFLRVQSPLSPEEWGTFVNTPPPHPFTNMMPGWFGKLNMNSQSGPATVNPATGQPTTSGAYPLSPAYSLPNSRPNSPSKSVGPARPSVSRSHPASPTGRSTPKARTPVLCLMAQSPDVPAPASCPASPASPAISNAGRPKKNGKMETAFPYRSPKGPFRRPPTPAVRFAREWTSESESDSGSDSGLDEQQPVWMADEVPYHNRNPDHPPDQTGRQRPSAASQPGRQPFQETRFGPDVMPGDWASYPYPDPSLEDHYRPAGWWARGPPFGFGGQAGWDGGFGASFGPGGFRPGGFEPGRFGHPAGPAGFRPGAPTPTWPAWGPLPCFWQGQAGMQGPFMAHPSADRVRSDPLTFAFPPGPIPIPRPFSSPSVGTHPHSAFSSPGMSTPIGSPVESGSGNGHWAALVLKSVNVLTKFPAAAPQPQCFGVDDPDAVSRLNYDKFVEVLPMTFSPQFRVQVFCRQRDNRARILITFVDSAGRTVRSCHHLTSLQIQRSGQSITLLHYDHAGPTKWRMWAQLPFTTYEWLTVFTTALICIKRQDRASLALPEPLLRDWMGYEEQSEFGGEIHEPGASITQAFQLFYDSITKAIRVESSVRFGYRAGTPLWTGFVTRPTAAGAPASVSIHHVQPNVIDLVGIQPLVFCNNFHVPQIPPDSVVAQGASVAGARVTFTSQQDADIFISVIHRLLSQ